MCRKSRSRWRACCSTCRRRRSAQACNATPANRSGSISPSNGRRSPRRPPTTNRPRRQHLSAENAAAAAAEPENERLFVTIAGLGAELPPLDRLRTIYPRYVESQASAGPNGLAILPFRAGTPYDGRRSGLCREQSRAVFRSLHACRQFRARHLHSGARCSKRPRSPSASRAPGLAIGKPSPPASTGWLRNCIRSEIGRSSGDADLG